ncbi:MAG: hypothetical protein ACQEQ4_03770 [Fibrobacterota bacterium]
MHIFPAISYFIVTDVTSHEGVIISTDCPCPSECDFHGDCRNCIEQRPCGGDLPYCKTSKNRDAIPSRKDDRVFASGKEIRLLDYAPCAG